MPPSRPYRSFQHFSILSSFDFLPQNSHHLLTFLLAFFIAIMNNAGATIARNRQETYIRARDSPLYNGLRRTGLERTDDQALLDSHRRSNSINVDRSVSDSCDTRLNKSVSDITGGIMALPFAFSDPEPFGRSSSERWLKTEQITPFVQLGVKSELNELYSKYVGNGCSPRTSESDEKHTALEAPARPKFEKTYIVTGRKEKLPNISFPISAAEYYNGLSPEMEIVESCESMSELNAYLRARKDDVIAGVPGRFLHAVMGEANADIGTVASTIMYAFYLNETLKSEQFCTVPIINIKRANLGSHADLKWLLDSCQIDQSSLIFADEIDLSYYDLYGSLKIVLLKGSKISNKQEKLKQAVVEVFHCMKGEMVYPWVKTVSMAEDCSCCTAIAEKFSVCSPEILVGKSFSRLLLAGILLDTANLTDPRCTSKDKYITSLLMNGAGRLGCNGLYQLLKYKMHDMSTLQIADILQKDFKKWTELESADALSEFGMSCIGVSIEQLFAHTEHLAQEIQYFQSSEKLKVLIVVSGYYNKEKNFKREILVSAESVKLLESLIFFLDFNASRLPLKSFNLPGLRKEMKAFEIDKITPRKTIEELIEEFVGIRNNA